MTTATIAELTNTTGRNLSPVKRVICARSCVRRARIAFLTFLGFAFHACGARIGANDPCAIRFPKNFIVFAWALGARQARWARANRGPSAGFPGVRAEQGERVGWPFFRTAGKNANYVRCIGIMSLNGPPNGNFSSTTTNTFR